MSENSILIISPHPDDLEIGMGGTVAKMIAQGAEVTSVVVTDGGGSTNTLGLTRKEMATLRKDEVSTACSLLEINKLILLDLPDAKSENLPLLRVELSRILDNITPDEIYIPHPEIDKHPTHRAVSQTVVEKMREMSKAGSRIPERVWCYEVWTPFPEYDRIEDITGYIELKKASVNAHRSQLEYKDYTEGILGLNRYRAVFDERHGVTDEMYAEVFIELKI